MSFQTLFNSHVKPGGGIVNANSPEVHAEYMQQYLKEIDRFTKNERKTLDGIKEKLLKPTAIGFQSKENPINHTEIKLANVKLQRISFALKPTSRSQFAKGVMLELFTWMKFLLLVPPLLFIHQELPSLAHQTLRDSHTETDCW